MAPSLTTSSLFFASGLSAVFPVGCADSRMEGRPLVLLHCSGADRHHWKKMLGAWDAAEIAARRVIRPELFGYGETPAWPGPQSITLDDYAALVERMLPRGGEPIDLVGHSLGGGVALHMARRMPHRIRTLTLIEPAAFYLLRQDAESAALFSEIAVIAQAAHIAAAEVTTAGRQRGMECFFDYWSNAGRWQSLAPDIRDSMSQSIGAVSDDFTAAFNETATLAETAAAVTMPVLLIRGGQSPTPVRQIQLMLASALPDARLTQIDDAGHMSPLTHAAKLAELVRDFQNGIPPEEHRAAA
jgi:pimeloyl-ACP methyl ester carboxylesterase